VAAKYGLGGRMGVAGVVAVGASTGVVGAVGTAFGVEGEVTDGVAGVNVKAEFEGVSSKR
jgi:hypothetical protein